MKDLYICDSYYHLLIAIIKNIKRKKENDILFAAEGKNNVLINNNNLLERLDNSKIFNNIFFFDYSREQMVCDSKLKIIKHIKEFMLLNKVCKNYDFNFSNYNNIYIFLDTGLIGRVINRKGIKYHLIEDGLDCYKNNYNYIEKSKIKKFIKKIVYGYEGFASSKNIESIEVNDINGIKIDKKKCIEVPRNILFNVLSNKEKKEICYIFLGKMKFRIYKRHSILITQPLYQDGFLKSEEQQVLMYKHIIERYLNKENIIIKVHPRDKINYKKYFSDCIIFDKAFPIELFNFFPNKEFNKLATVSSTSISFINNTKEKIYLGWEWLDEYKKK